MSMLPLFSALQEQGIKPEALLAKHGLQLDKLSATSQIDFNTHAEIIREALPFVDDPLLGIRLGERVTMTSYGLFAMLLLSAPSLKHMIDCAVQYQRLSPNICHVSVHYVNNYVELRQTLPQLCDQRLKTYFVDYDFAGTAAFIREVTRGMPDLTIKSGIAREQPERDKLTAFTCLLGTTPQFGQTFSWVRIPTKMMTLKSHHSNALAHNLYKTQAQALIRQVFSESSDIVAQINVMLDGYNGLPYPNQPDIASQIGISESTMRRRLNTQGTSFRALAEKHKKNRAQTLLRLENTSVQHIALRLGYADSPTFVKAFKKWTGLTPRQFRLSM
ncbi:AraC family transcriptional regulator ligand-binding domain-containing protein [Alteromonas gracilis]|uniref:AraC family transcriptional regulator n=1 Tax=Alteromonas gracilis TaxID=1479524 RepID=UPI003736B3E7